MIQYYHNMANWIKDDRYTVAVDLPTKEELLDLAGNLKVTSFQIKVAFSLVNPKDRYIKKVGRELSSSRIKDPTEFFLTRCHYYSDSIILHLDSDGPVHYLKIRIVENSNKPHLLQASLQVPQNNL